DSNEEMLAKISAGNSGYDLVIGSDYIIDIARKQDLLQELDKSKIPNYANLDEGYLSKFYDPENKYTVPYSAGSPVILYDEEKIGMEINGYEDLWNEKLKGKLLLIDDARNII
ncbi:MAG: extracellular solute-binding protein, partial [Clostridia bacterium]|nr:extracellular solute-binding protein [Clostridia bacterium]